MLFLKKPKNVHVGRGCVHVGMCVGLGKTSLAEDANSRNRICWIVSFAFLTQALSLPSGRRPKLPPSEFPHYFFPGLIHRVAFWSPCCALARSSFRIIIRTFFHSFVLAPSPLPKDSDVISSLLQPQTILQWITMCIMLLHRYQLTHFFITKPPR